MQGMVLHSPILQTQECGVWSPLVLQTSFNAQAQMMRYGVSDNQLSDEIEKID